VVRAFGGQLPARLDPTAAITTTRSRPNPRPFRSRGNLRLGQRDFDRQVLALNVAGLFQTLETRADD